MRPHEVGCAIHNSTNLLAHLMPVRRSKDHEHSIVWCRGGGWRNHKVRLGRGSRGPTCGSRGPTCCCSCCICCGPLLFEHLLVHGLGAREGHAADTWLNEAGVCRERARGGGGGREGLVFLWGGTSVGASHDLWDLVLVNPSISLTSLYLTLDSGCLRR